MKATMVLLTGLLPVCLFAQTKPAYKEPYRPQYHFSPHHNWTNDPNGLVYYKGEYHLFYQYNPMGNTWGHMSWAHAISKDLVHWQSLPLAIPEDEKNMIFSGSCVVDKNNSSGFAQKPGQIPLVAVYTAHIIPDKSKPDDYLQNQHIAYSLDDGRTWTKYSGNPVLDLHKKDFRDPKVFWYEPGKKWIMVTVLPNEHIVQFHGSADLKTWSHLSDFGPAGDTNGIWECPDLLQVPVIGQAGKNKWVLLNSQQFTMQYFVGEFDGTVFHNETPSDTVLRPDYGPDFYAGITYNNLPFGHDPVLLGWANNWKYAQNIPTSPWRSAMSLPRSLRLKKDGNTWTLLQQPVKSLQTLRGGAPIVWTNKTITGSQDFPAKGQVIELETALFPAKDGVCGIRLAAGKEQAIIISYDAASQKLTVDRSKAGSNSFDNQFANFSSAAVRVPLQNTKLRLHVFLDKSILEVYANDGAVVLTTQLFPDAGLDGIVFFSEKGAMRILSATVWTLRSVW
ncbi:MULTISPECIES: glycoside hydrolase family 32 protein [Niastella]|uniref:Glycoside hydrolase family 32 protein n=1 Tax=Niastella soli TaxID=2821487 RepID=A0ABS3YPD5_9BACT|nr:glycoside hydrolase family 32 protein [Niastella soli]MBO9199748.1 glycoside hydrolase family 32 protein [Niastella soli]